MAWSDVVTSNTDFWAKFGKESTNFRPHADSIFFGVSWWQIIIVVFLIIVVLAVLIRLLPAIRPKYAGS